MQTRRVGIFAGSFNPVHAGHIRFALQSIKDVNLDVVYLLPERFPRFKPHPEHYGHRSAMISRAIRPFAKLSLLELPDKHFDVPHTLPVLETKFPSDQLVFLMGSDVALTIYTWPEIDRMLSRCELVVGMRDKQDEHDIETALRSLPVKTRYSLIDSKSQGISSTSIRKALSTSRQAAGLLSSVASYARSEWLYVSLSGGGAEQPGN